MLFRFAILSTSRTHLQCQISFAADSHNSYFLYTQNSTSHDNYILPSEVLFHCPRYLVLFLF
nr:MAG TPA: hypothetical protein [Caudoviricetes sp.]